MRLSSLEDRIRKAPTTTSIDDDDEMIAALDDSLAAVRRGMENAEALRLTFTGWRYWPVRLLLRVSMRQLRRLYRRIELLRRYILEHDADASGLGPSFEHADEIIDYLHAH